MIFRILKSNNDFKGLKEINEIEIHNDLELYDYVLVHKHLKKTFIKSLIYQYNRVFRENMFSLIII